MNNRLKTPRDKAAVAVAKKLHQALKAAGFETQFAGASSDGYLPVTVVKGVGCFYNTDEEVYADAPHGEGEEVECSGPAIVAWAKRCKGPILIPWQESDSKVLSLLLSEAGESVGDRLAKWFAEQAYEQGVSIDEMGWGLDSKEQIAAVRKGAAGKAISDQETELLIQAAQTMADEQGVSVEEMTGVAGVDAEDEEGGHVKHQDGRTFAVGYFRKANVIVYNAAVGSYLGDAVITRAAQAEVEKMGGSTDGWWFVGEWERITSLNQLSSHSDATVMDHNGNKSTIDRVQRLFNSEAE
jgi:hypothetical protein